MPDFDPFEPASIFVIFLQLEIFFDEHVGFGDFDFILVYFGTVVLMGEVFHVGNAALSDGGGEPQVVFVMPLNISLDQALDLLAHGSVSAASLLGQG